MNTRRNFLKSIGLATVTATLGSSVGGITSSPMKRPNVLLIVSEDNGPELGCYGEPYVQTPVLDKLAADGVRFQNAFVTYSVCSPSRATFLTGLYPAQNGQIGLATHKYAMYRNWPNIPSLLKQNGYRTGIIGKLHVNPESAFPFDFRWNDGKFISFAKRNIEKISEVADGFFRQSDQPFFLSVNFPDAHFNLIRQQYGYPEKPLTGKDVKTLKWVGVDSERIREYTADYYNCLMRLDAGVGMLLKKLKAAGKANNTIIMYIGDHGAQFSRGKTSVYEAALRIPMIVCWPGRAKSGSAPEELISTIDILPTVLEATGIKAPRNLPGRSLMPLIQGKKVSWRTYIFAETNGSAPVLYYPQFSVRDKRYKLVFSPLRDRPNTCAKAYMNHHNAFFYAGATQEEIDTADEKIRTAYRRYLNPPVYELYDLKNDPYEFEDLGDNPQFESVKQRLIKTLGDWMNETDHPLRDPEKLKLLTEEHDRLLNYNYHKDKKFRWGYLDYFKNNRKDRYK